MEILLPLGFMVLIGILLQIVLILLFRKNGYARPDDVRQIMHEQTKAIAELVRAWRGQARRKKEGPEA